MGLAVDRGVLVALLFRPDQLRLKMRNLYKWDTSIGAFFIAEHEGRYLAIFDDENLGSYSSVPTLVE
jgi:hypothetical protein